MMQQQWKTFNVISKQTYWALMNLFMNIRSGGGSTHNHFIKFTTETPVLVQIQFAY